MLRLIRHAFQPISLRFRRRARAFAFVTVGAMLAITTAPATLAAAIDPGTLNPVPPDFYTCRATGDGAICRAHTVSPYSGEATGIFCGSGASTVELLDNGIRDVEATRWYDGNLNLTARPDDPLPRRLPEQSRDRIDARLCPAQHRHGRAGRTG